MQHKTSSDQYLIKQVTPVLSRKPSPLYRQNPTQAELTIPFKAVFFAHLLDCFIALFLIIGIITMLSFVVHLVMGA